VVGFDGTCVYPTLDPNKCREKNGFILGVGREAKCVPLTPNPKMAPPDSGGSGDKNAAAPKNLAQQIPVGLIAIGGVAIIGLLVGIKVLRKRSS
jgi:hypothetical protein